MRTYKNIGSLFIGQILLGEFMSETEPGTCVTINEYDYEPLCLKYETELTLVLLEQVWYSLVTSVILFRDELYGLIF